MAEALSRNEPSTLKETPADSADTAAMPSSPKRRRIYVASEELSIVQKKADQKISHDGIPTDWRHEDTPGPGKWTINVASTHSIDCQTFHVDESVIANGPIHSGYFNRLFQSKDMIKASGTTVIPIQLAERAAELFPSLLDFLYSSPHFQITTETAVGLRYLAEFFKVPKMQDVTWDFIKKDMALHNLERYLNDSNDFGDTQTATWVAFECAKRIASLDPDTFSPVLQKLIPDDFKQMIFLARLSHKGNSAHSSELVAAYCFDRARDLDAHWFKELTCSQNLPEISPKAALKLMETEFIVRSRANVENPSERLSSLQRRCVKALANETEGDTASRGMKNAPRVLRNA